MLPSENPVKTSNSPTQINKHVYWVQLKVPGLDEQCELVGFHASQRQIQSLVKTKHAGASCAQ